MRIMSAKARKALPRIHLTIEISGSVARELERRVETGLYGVTLSDAAERILCEGLRQLIAADVFARDDIIEERL